MFRIPNPTKAQALFLHTLEGVIGSAVLAALTAGGQQVFQGNVHVQVVATVAASAFAASLLKGYTTAVKPADASAALFDTLGEVRDMVAALAQLQPVEPSPITAVRPAVRKSVTTKAMEPTPIRLPSKQQPVQPPDGPDLGG